MPVKNSAINVTNVRGGTAKINKIVKGLSDSKLNTVNVIPSTVKASFAARNANKGSPAELADKLVFTVKSGTAASLNYTSTDNYASRVLSQGKTTITANSITVSADAKPTDSVNSEYIQVIVE